MLNAGRRGHASVVKLCANFTSSAAIRTFSALSIPQISKSSRTSQLRYFNYSSRLNQAAAATAPVPNGSVQTEETFMITRFQDLATHGLVSRTVVNTLTQDMRLETMTPVQCETINETLKGDDV